MGVVRVTWLLVLPAILVSALTIWASSHESKKPVKRVRMIGVFKYQDMQIKGAKVWKITTKSYRHKRTTHKIEREL